MAIKEQLYYTVQCDWPDCKTTSGEDSEYSAWADADQAVEQAENADWLTVQKITEKIFLSNTGVRYIEKSIVEVYYCPNHSHWDDEKDERVPGPTPFDQQIKEAMAYVLRAANYKFDRAIRGVLSEDPLRYTYASLVQRNRVS